MRTSTSQVLFSTCGANVPPSWTPPGSLKSGGELDPLLERLPRAVGRRSARAGARRCRRGRRSAPGRRSIWSPSPVAMPAPRPSLSLIGTLQVTRDRGVGGDRPQRGVARGSRAAAPRAGSARAAAATECTGATPSPFQPGRSARVGRQLAQRPGSSAPALRTGCSRRSTAAPERSSPNWASRRHVTSGRNHGVSSRISRGQLAARRAGADDAEVHATR